jgi:diguanylate cyclase (GGDEF)-like protein
VFVTNKNSTPTEEKQTGWLSILGLSSVSDADWGLVRGGQISEVRRFALFRLIFSVIAAWGVFSSMELSGTGMRVWLIITMLSSVGLSIPQLRQREFPRISATNSELHLEGLSLFGASLAWGTLPFFFGRTAGPMDILTMWAVLTTLMGAATFFLSAVPLGAATFVLVLGSGLSWLSLQLGLPVVGALTASYTLALVAACLATGKTFALHRYNQIALKEKSEMVSLLLREYEDSGGDFMWQTDASRCLTHVSPRLAKELGLDEKELEAKPLLQILAGDKWHSGNLPTVLNDLSEKMKNRESFSDVVIPMVIKGEHHWWALSAQPRTDDNGAFAGFRGVGADVTAERRSSDKINQMARFDGLTGLPNRLQLTEALTNALQQAEQWRSRAGFMMIDLDRFKAVNDTLGHPVGDRLLAQVAHRLRSIMTSNELCGRLGGDEFAVVVKEVKQADHLDKVASAIIATLSEPYTVDEHTIYIGASVGTAISPRDGRTVETLVRSSDLALYRSKEQGGGAHNIYEPQLHTHAEERRVLEIALRKALERNEMELHYQPVVNGQSGMLESFEALLRWNNPDLGMVSPGKFIPIAEDARLIRPIGEWVLRTACMEAVRWPSHVRIAVNVSAEQLTDPSFVSTVMSALSQSGLPPHRLELEVTESMFMKDGGNAVAVLQKVLDLGIKLSLDDFGTGYSSLGYLSKTKFSTIKVDRSFVQGAARNLPESIAIIRAVVALADSLGMSTTAEGVETEEECRLVNELGCKKIQGYLFGRPMPAHEAMRVVDASVGRAQVA